MFILVISHARFVAVENRITFRAVKSDVDVPNKIISLTITFHKSCTEPQYSGNFLCSDSDLLSIEKLPPKSQT
jgi:hypothetical protein